jgi:hypothetical protein
MRRVVAFVVLLACACSTRTAGEDAGTTTMMGGGSTSDAQDTSIGTTTSGDGDGDGDGDADEDSETTGIQDVGPSGDGDGDDCTEPQKLDLPPDFENTPMPQSCTIEEIEFPTLEQYPGCGLCWGECYAAYLGCATPAPGQTCADICPSGDCIASHPQLCSRDVYWEEMTDTCGYFEIDGQCCTIGRFLSCWGE